MTRFKAPVEHARTREGDAQNIGRFAGMPVGIQLYSDWKLQYINFDTAASLPVNATSWTITATGAGALTTSDDLFPGHLIVTNAAADNDSQEAQWTAADGTGEWIDLTTDRPCYFETMIRFRDAGNVLAAVSQVDWFVGLCNTDTTIIDGATDFVGFTKRDITDDATSNIYFVCGDAGGGAGALVDQLATATGWTANGVNTSAATDRSLRRLGANQWIKLAMLIEPQALGTTGFAYCWINDAPIAANPINLTGFIPDENICLSFGVQNGEGVIKIMDVAYFILAQSYRNNAGVLP